MSYLEVIDLLKRFNGTVPALDHVSFRMEKGEIISILGESGCGKTTLLRTIGGFETPDSGKINLDGVEFNGTTTFVKPEKRGVGIIFQDHSLFPNMNVSENISFGLHKMESKQRALRCAEMLEKVQLTDLGNRMPHELSGGQRQRVAIARALAPSPKMLLLDEPFSNLDSQLKDQLRMALKQLLKEEGITALLVSHDIGDALATADRIGWMHAGELVQLDTPMTLYTKPAHRSIAQLFGKVNCLEEALAQKLFGSSGLEPFPKLKFDDAVWRLLRPNQLCISTGGHASGIVEGCIFAGQYFEVLIRMEEQLIFLHHAAPLVPGIPVNLGLKG